MTPLMARIRRSSRRKRVPAPVPVEVEQQPVAENPAPVEDSPNRVAQAVPAPEPEPEHQQPDPEPEEPAPRRPHGPTLGAQPEPPVAPSPAPAAEAPPAGPGIGRAVARYPLAVALPVSLLLCGALALGLAREPAYKTSTSLYVGKLDVSSQAIPGYVTAATTLASAYSRIAESPQVLAPTAARLHVPYESLAGRVTATPVPESPVFRVTGEAPSEREAVALARTVTSVIGSYVARASTVSGGTGALLVQYRQAVMRAGRLRARVKGLQPGGGRSTTSASELENAQVAAQTADLQVQTLGVQYSNSVQNARGAVLTVLNPATRATSDRQSVLQRLAFIGFFGGLVIGLGLAVLLNNRRAVRTPRKA